MALIPKTPIEAEELRKAARSYVAAFHGRREIALLLLGGMLLAAAPRVVLLQWLFGSAVGTLRLVLFGVGALSLGWGFILIFRQATPKKVEPLPAKPAPIVGTAPFGAVHAEIFARLERETEIGVLLGHVMDDNSFPVIVLLGPSGVGKTSLVKAGLTHALRDCGRPLVFWSANEREARSLFEIICAQWVSNGGPPKRIEDLVERRRTEPHVIVLDQMERLSPGIHGEVFDLIKRIASAPLPSMLTLVIVLQQERLLDWFKFQAEELQPERIRHLPLSPFRRREAEDVLVTLLNEIHLTIDRADLRRVIADIADGEEVLPADVGVVVLMLSEILQSDHISSERLRAMGGASGLRSAYVRRLLSLLPKSLQGEVLRALLGLVDTRTLQPLAKGLAVDDLVRAVKPANEVDFINALDSLAIPFARLLLKETVNDVPRYRLLHKALVRALLHVADVQSVPAAEVLEAAYEIHLANPDYLLPSKGLKTVRKALKEGSLVVIDLARIEYIRRSRRAWWRRRLSQCALSAAILVVGTAGYLYIDQRRERQLLESWGLPSDLADEPLRSLSLGTAVNRLDWLPRSIEDLRLNRSRIRSLDGLPKGLKTLQVSYTHLEGLGELPGGLIQLDVDSNRLKSLRGTPELLRSLNFSEEGVDLEELYRFRKLTSLAVSRSGHGKLNLERLPDSLQALSLIGVGIDSPAHFPGRLTSLRLVGRSVKAFEGVEDLPDLKALSFVKGDVPLRLDRLPGGLRQLELDHQNTTGILRLPVGLERLVIKKEKGACFAEGTVFPGTLTHLSLYGCDYDLDRLPQTLTSLALDARSVRALNRLPRSLRSVRLDMFPGQDLVGLPSHVESVVITLSKDLRSLRGLPETVRVLELSGCLSLRDLSFLSKKLETLTFRWSGMTRMPRLPDSLRKLDLLGSERLQAVAKLPPNLHVLNIAGTRIRGAGSLPKSIEVLHLSPDQMREFPRQLHPQAVHFVEDSADARVGRRHP